MGLWDAALEIGTSIVSSAFGSGGDSGSSTVVAPTYGSSLIQPLAGAGGKTSQTERRSLDKTKRAQTVEEKQQRKRSGDDPVELAKMWNALLKETALNGAG